MRLALLIPLGLMLVAPVPRVVYAADISVRVLPESTGSDETCGVTWSGRCEAAIWCDDWYAPITVPYGDAVATANCGGYFGSVFAWGASGYGEAQAFEPIGPGGPILVTCFPQWGESGVEAVEFRIHNVGLYEYIGDFLNGDADFNSDGATTLDDLFAFLDALLG